MANDYIKLWVKDYRALLEPFSEAERGRILWAMMDYKESRSEPSFLGNERFVWAAIKKIRKTQKTEWVLKRPKNWMILMNSRRLQPDRPMESRRPTGYGLDAIRCSRLIWPQNFETCGKLV